MKLAQFAAWVIEDGLFNGCHLDGGAVQEMAVKMGLLVETKYDPAIHGETDICEPGDSWFVYSDKMTAVMNNE